MRAFAIQPLIAVCVFAATVAHAAFPDRPITMVLPYAPGGAADAVARVLATRMGARLGASVIVDNKAEPGEAELRLGRQRQRQRHRAAARGGAVPPEAATGHGACALQE